MRTFKTIIGCVCVMVSCSIILSTAGCKAHSALEKTTHDTVKVERVVTYRDTVFKSTPVAVETYVSIPCPDFKMKPITKQNQHAKLTVKQVGQILGFECMCDTVAIKAQVREVVEKEYRSHQEFEQKTIEVKYVPGWVKFFGWSGAAFWLLVLIAVVLFIYKPFKIKF